MKALLIAVGVVCSLTGGASGELYSARTRTVRGPHQRSTRLPVRDADHACEWDAVRLVWLTHHDAPQRVDPAVPAAAAHPPERLAFSGRAPEFRVLFSFAARAFPHRGRSPPLVH